MKSKHLKTRTFRDLHGNPKKPLILPNVWDVAGARLVESLGAKAVATTSAGVAWSLGYPDGNFMPARLQARLAEEIVNAVNKSYLNLTFDTRYDDPKDPNRFFYRSDHFNYAKKGIPIIFFFDGVHEDYHRKSDTADKIDYQKMEKVTRTIYMTVWEIANRAVRLKVDKPLPLQIQISSN